MAKQEPKKTNVRRIKASESDNSTADKTEKKVMPKAATTKKSSKSAAATAKVKPAKKTHKTEKPLGKYFFLFVPFVAFFRYVRNSWIELRQVRWTNRRATWALTLAVILFSLFFAILILLLDWLFNILVQEVMS